MADFSALKQTIQAYVKQNGNEEITGNILKDVLLAMVTTMGDGAINSLSQALQEEAAVRKNHDETLQGNITAVATALGGRIDGLQTAINGINTKLAEGYIYAGIATPSTNPGIINGKVFYVAVQAGTYTDFGGTVITEGITILKFNGSAWSSDHIIAIDDEPTAGSSELVKSGGVYQLGQKVLVPEIEILTGGYIDGGNGELTVFTEATAYYTDFIPLVNDLLFFYTGRAMYAVCQWAFYDKNKVFISSYRAGTGTDVYDVKVENIPSNAFYIRFSSIFTQMVVWVVSKEKLYSLHLENVAAIDANTNAIKQLSNLFSIPNYDRNGYYETGSGNYVAFNDAKVINDYYPIADCINYVITGYSNYAAALFVIYDEQKNVLGTYPATGGTGIITTNKSFRELMSIPSNAKYIRFGTLFPGSYDYSVKIYFITNPNSKIWSGKKWAVIGDSLTEHNNAALKQYHDYISEKTGLSVTNLGVSGTGYAKTTTSAFYLRVNSIPSDTDVITVFGSGNDLGYLPLGEVTDTGTETLCGCINTTIDAIIQKFPLIPFGIITPTPWFDSWTPEAVPNVMSNYSDAIAEICKRKGVPCLNLFYCSNLHPEIPAIRAIEYKRDGTYEASTESTPNAIQVTEDMLSYIRTHGVSDAEVGDWVLGTLNGVHPDEDGHKLFAPRIEAFLKTLLLN